MASITIFISSPLFHALLAVAWCIILQLTATFSFAEATFDEGGFSTALIHRDSPRSPFYNPYISHSERLRRAFRRSFSRITHFKPISVESSPKIIQAPVIANSGEYLMKISIGTPPVQVLGIADTGSDLTWTQCKPCTRCYKQLSPLFDPNSSSTYTDVSCQSTQCDLLDQAMCSGSKDLCWYDYSYADRSFTNGNLAVETITIDSTSGHKVALPNITFGCGHNNRGSFDKRGSGLIGLGGGRASLTSQLGNSIDGKFSYCLVPFTNSKDTSMINFGSSAVVSGSGVVSTPISRLESLTFYALTLQEVSVGNNRLPYREVSEQSSKAVARTEGGNIIIDSGTTLTLLPRGFYEVLESALLTAINGTRVKDPGGVLDLCYRTEGKMDVPDVTFHFAGEADVKLREMNTFVRVEKDVMCLSMVPVEDEGVAIFGNLAQMNFLVGYDVKNRMVSFLPTDCTKH